MLQLADAGLIGVAWLVDTDTQSQHKARPTDLWLLMMRYALPDMTVAYLDDGWLMADDTSPQQAGRLPKSPL